MDKEVKLLPCPFCGREAIIREIEPHKHYFCKIPDYEGGTFIECSNCTCMISAETKEKAIKVWNNRKTIEKMVEQLRDRAFERYKNIGMGGQMVVDFDDIVDIISKKQLK